MDNENIFGGELLLETGTNEIQLVEFVLRIKKEKRILIMLNLNNLLGGYA